MKNYCCAACEDGYHVECRDGQANDQGQVIECSCATKDHGIKDDCVIGGLDQYGSVS